MTDAAAADGRARIRPGLASLVPALTWLPRYDRGWLAKDLVGGLAAGAVVVPQAMAYATIAKLPVEVGLYTCMVPMLVYVLLGGSRTLSMSTTSTVATLTASSLLAAGVAADTDDPFGALAMLTLLVGVILLGARVLRLGTVIDNISEATLTGVKTGVGLTVAVSQLPKLLGIPGDPTADNFFQDVGAVIDQIGDASVTTVVFSIATLAILLGVARYLPKVPGPLVAVVVGIGLVGLASIDDHGIALIDPVPSGLPTPVAPSYEHLGDLLPGAFAIAIMCFLETASVARGLRRTTEPPIDNDQELVANSVSCLAGAFFRAMPSAGGFSQSAVNQSSGARTQVSEVVTVVLAVLSALFLGGVLSDLPEATLGCMVMIAVASLIRPSEFVRFWRLSRVEFWVAAITAVVGLSVGLLAAVLVGVLLTLLLVIIELDHIGVTELQATSDGDDVQVAGEATVSTPGLLMLRFDGPLYTANVRNVNRDVLAALDSRGEIDTVVLDASALAMVTVTVLDQFADLDREVAQRGVELWVAAMPPRTLAVASRDANWSAYERAGRVHPTSLAAVRAYRSRPRSER